MENKVIICANCRSTLLPVSHFDVGAPSLQVLQCPVCDQDIWLSKQSWFNPQTFELLMVVDKSKEPIPTPKNMGTKANDPSIAIKDVSPLDAARDFWGEKITAFTNPLAGGLKTAGIFVIVALALVAIIVLKKR